MTIEITLPECDHPDFAVNAAVKRISTVEGGPIVAYNVDVAVKCVKCGTPFRWLGLPCGSSASVPMVSVDGLELRAPIAPQGVETNTNLPGFAVNMRGAH